jgi:hypothetical protein
VATEPGPMGWRVGRSLGRTIYHDNEFMGIMETAELAELVVTLLQEAGSSWDAGWFGAQLVRPREFHQRAGSDAFGPTCTCGAQWLTGSGACSTRFPGRRS